MKGGWLIKPIGEIADACLGKMLDKNKNRGTPKPYLRNLNVRWFGFDLSDLLEMRFEDDERDRYTAKKGDLLICEGGYPGRAAIWEDDEPIYFQKAIHRVRFYEPERAKWFLYYLSLCDIDGSLRSHFTGAGIQHFTGEALKRFHVPLPPLPEQQRIVSILDEAFAGLPTATANAEKNLKNARELFESYLNSIFTKKRGGWNTSELGSEVRFVDYRGKTPPKMEAGIRLITAKNVKMNRIQRDPEEFIDASVYDGWMTRGYPKKGDVLFTTEAPLGNVAQLDTDETVVIGQRLITMQPDEGVLDRTFLKYALMSPPTQAEIHKRGTGATVVGIKASLLKQVPISFPVQVADQRALAGEMENAAENVAQLEENFRRKVIEIAALKQSILQKAFSGELTLPPSQAIKEAAE